MRTTNLRPAASISVSIFAAASAFAALARGELTGPVATGWEPFFMLLLPGSLIGLMLVAFMLLPLWCFFAGARSNARLAFALTGAAIWLLACGVLIALSGLDRQSALQWTVSLLIPGWVLISTFGLLADKRHFVARDRISKAARSTASGRAGRAAFKLAPGGLPLPGGATAGD